MDSNEKGKGFLKEVWVLGKLKTAGELGIPFDTSLWKLKPKKYFVTITDAPRHRDFSKTWFWAISVWLCCPDCCCWCWWICSRDPQEQADLLVCLSDSHTRYETTNCSCQQNGSHWAPLCPEVIQGHHKGGQNHVKKTWLNTNTAAIVPVSSGIVTTGWNKTLTCPWSHLWRWQGQWNHAAWGLGLHPAANSSKWQALASAPLGHLQSWEYWCWPCRLSGSDWCSQP